MLTREEARKKIQKIIQTNEPVATGIRLPIRNGATFNAYNIPISCLVPNLLNDRIAWKIKEFEAKNNRKLNVDNEEDIKYVYTLILGEHKNENEQTLKDIAKNGQQRIGVITNDGIIIDGNRRATLIKELFEKRADEFHQSIENFRYFRTVVLDKHFEDSEIMALETMLQIGEDEKVGYNPINIYIKVDNLIKAGFNVSQISQYMNESEGKIKERIETFELMNMYLEMIGKKDQYTMLDGLEDQFLNSNRIFKKLDSKTYNAQWEYDEIDISDFKQVVFDYMRVGAEGKNFRDNLLGKPQKTDGVFIKKEVWQKFLEIHQNIIDQSNLEKEEDWKMLKPQVQGNLKHATKLLETFVEEKNISNLIELANGKIDQLKELLDRNEIINSEDLQNLKEMERKIYRIRKEYE